MSKYILYLKHKKPGNNMKLECTTAQEAAKYKRKAIKQGYLVEVKKEGEHGEQ